MNSPKDKLIVALDVDNARRALELFAALRVHITTFKIGMQLFTAAGPDIVRQIVARGNRVFLDLKYHDIPNTVAMAAIEATRLGVSMFNIHSFGGGEMMRRAAAAVAEVSAREGLTRPTLLGVTLLTSIDEQTLNEIGVNDPPAAVVPRLAALANASGLDGVVASARELEMIRGRVGDPNFVIVCPGMRGANAAADDQRRTMSAAAAIRAGADFVVVGRPILEANDPVRASLQLLDEILNAVTDSSQSGCARR